MDRAFWERPIVVSLTVNRVIPVLLPLTRPAVVILVFVLLLPMIPRAVVSLRMLLKKEKRIVMALVDVFLAVKYVSHVLFVMMWFVAVIMISAAAALIVSGTLVIAVVFLVVKVVIAVRIIAVKALLVIVLLMAEDDMKVIFVKKSMLHYNAVFRTVLLSECIIFI